ncbi:MAG: OmpA family protein, partial [Bacteroidaceae bacterium]|nr:OmpA family protein [Bacteroidaceae bacterium]
GLAWTAVGGVTLTIEANVMDGKGEIQLTGQLGDVMKESARAALSYIRANLAELTVDENLLIPEIGKRQKARVCKLQAAEAQRLSTVKGLDVELTRDDEVIHITIAASLLFAPNETTLLDSSDTLLRSILPCLRVPDYYHVLLIMHSDNTGNESYNYALTTDRVSAIYDWMEQNGGCVDYVVPYAAGSYEPIASNSSIAGRAQNRRLEIYLIPAEAMIKK